MRTKGARRCVQGRRSTTRRSPSKAEKFKSAEIPRDRQRVRNVPSLRRNERLLRPCRRRCRPRYDARHQHGESRLAGVYGAGRRKKKSSSQTRSITSRMLSYKKLSPEEMKAFTANSVSMLEGYYPLNARKGTSKGLRSNTERRPHFCSVGRFKGGATDFLPKDRRKIHPHDSKVHRRVKEGRYRNYADLTQSAGSIFF